MTDHLHWLPIVIPVFGAVILGLFAWYDARETRRHRNHHRHA